MILAACAGFLAGAVHVFSGPDHLAALAPLSIRARRRSWSLGLRWGLGHSAGVVAVAIFAALFRAVVAPDLLSGWAERLVGVVLIWLGLLGFRHLLKDTLHAHPHEHDGDRHAHFHLHDPHSGHEAREAHVHLHTAFFVGTLHGFAGTSHLLGVLPALALSSGSETAAYLVAFAFGTIAAMTFFSAALGFSVPRSPERGLRIYRLMLTGASGAAVVVGLYWTFLPLLGAGWPE